MRPAYLSELSSPIPTSRYAAWEKLGEQPETESGFLTLADRRELGKVLDAEENQEVQTFALVQINKLASAVEQPMSLAGGDGKTQVRQSLTVDEWFGTLFNTRAALFGITESGYCRRDEDALIHLAYRLPRTNPPLKICRVTRQSDVWQSMQTEAQYNTMLFVGRLWLYGPKALKMLTGKNMRFQFPNNSRPQKLDKDKIDPKYHSIREQIDGQPSVDYVAHDHEGPRTDYALVQIYTVVIGSCPVTIVQVAGTSSLGTMGAAMWLTYDVSRPLVELGGSPIPMPPGGAKKHRVEALLRVQAETTTSVWKPDLIELSALHVDDYYWYLPDSQWHRSAAPCIQLHVKGHPAGTGLIYINQQPTTFQLGSQKNRLAVAVLCGALRNPEGSVSLEELAAKKKIWGNDLPSCAKVRQRLHGINDQLEGLLEIGDVVRVNAQIQLIDKPLARMAATSV